MEVGYDYGNDCEENEYDDDIIWQDNEMGPAGPYDDYSNNQFYNQGGFRRGGGRGYGPPRHFNQHGPPGPSGGSFMWGRGYGNAGPPNQQRYRRERDNNPMRYLIRCGVPKENLRGLPKVLLQLMNPEYCGVCAMGFDHFTASRLHYISKNHMKNQRKWLSQQAELGACRPKEIPLKARELYCELCDVHITSKTHADSHYSGKPHRAIVEGRKKPKNPYLLQRGMQDRVDQLVRREKKHLKSTDDAEAAQEVAKESKPVQPELYCEICKTSVTCTEQMTMHLNGKRHLSKEKQHILRMMKGGAQENNDKSSETDDANKAAENQAEGEEAKEYLDDDENKYDWGNGSGTWDDDPQ